VHTHASPPPHVRCVCKHLNSSRLPNPSVTFAGSRCSRCIHHSRSSSVPAGSRSSPSSGSSCTPDWRPVVVAAAATAAGPECIHPTGTQRVRCYVWTTLTTTLNITRTIYDHMLLKSSTHRYVGKPSANPYLRTSLGRKYNVKYTPEKGFILFWFCTIMPQHTWKLYVIDI